MQSPSAPQAPNAQQIGQQQAQMNLDTGIANAWLGNTNQVTPYGNLTYSQTGTQSVGGRDVPQFTATQTLSPEQQAIYDKTTGLQSGALDTAKTVLGQVNNTVATPLNFDSAPKLPTDQTQLRNDAYAALTSRSNTDLDRSETAQKAQLANQGIEAGSEAYTRALDPINRARVDASNQATINAGNIAGQNLSQAQTLRNQSINETQSIRNQPLSDYATLAGFGGGVTQPTYATPTQATVANTDITSPAYNSYKGQLQQYQQQLGANNSAMGGLFGLGGAGLGGLMRNASLFGGAAGGASSLGGASALFAMSDARVKEDIEPVGQTYDGQNLYSFRYIGDPTPRVGLMDQEVEQRDPGAVVEIGGIKHVNYDRALHRTPSLFGLGGK